MKQVERAAWLTLGIGAGASIVFLFGTSDGKRLRRKVSNRIEEGRDRIVETASEICDKGREVAHDAGKFVSSRAKSLVA